MFIKLAMLTVQLNSPGHFIAYRASWQTFSIRGSSNKYSGFAGYIGLYCIFLFYLQPFKNKHS